jgi:hypothetical protein
MTSGEGPLRRDIETPTRDELVQFCTHIHPAFRREIAVRAIDANMTVQQYVNTLLEHLFGEPASLSRPRPRLFRNDRKSSPDD